MNKFLITNKNALNDYDYYDYHPKTKQELEDIIINLLKQGITDLNCIDVSEITDMSALFYMVNKQINVKDIDISEWDVSKVKYMCDMFNGCNNFNSDLSEWDVSKVKNMYCMFNECRKFNSNLSNWCVSNVIDMFSMFNECRKFNSDISKWNVSKVEDMEEMFYNCYKFNSDLSNWDVSNVQNMNGIFFGCNSLTKIPAWYWYKYE